MEFEKQWNLEMALAVLGSETVDSRTWSEAVKWLILHGPPEMRDILTQASAMATSEYFPELKPVRYTPDGQPCYDIQAMAASLGVTVDEVRDQIRKMEEEQGVRHFIDPGETHEVQ
ncbi:MAG: hypothetical protein L3J03_03280 [Desulfobacterales bacterium]|nr:hypothetical protein [Desulfobacterales bacterium]